MFISYKVELHDIIELTAPMWDACGVECPAMIGAECPRDDSFPPVRCPGWSAKYPNAASEVIHSWTLESFQDEECGDSVEGSGWFALFVTSPEESAEDNAMGAGVILHETPQGHVSATRFDAPDALMKEWRKLLAEHGEDE